MQTTKVVVGSPVVAGEVAEWDVTVSNAGPSTAKAVTITDLLDARLSFVSTGSDGRCVIDGQLVSCPVGDIVPGASVTVRVRTLVGSDAAAGSVIANQAGVDTSTPDPDPSCGGCGATVEVSASADLETTKTLLTNPIVAGGLVRWQISVTNNGPSTARSVMISDALADTLVLFNIKLRERVIRRGEVIEELAIKTNRQNINRFFWLVLPFQQLVNNGRKTAVQHISSPPGKLQPFIHGRSSGLQIVQIGRELRNFAVRNGDP